ncbi:leucine-rich repeat, cysteine-containing subtype protein [Tanacetum coccineum]
MTRKYSLKFPNIVKVAFFSLSPKLQKLDLELKYKPCELDFDDDGLRTVANACSHLRQIVLSRRLRVGDLGVDSIVRSCKNLQELDLAGCLSVTDESLKAIGESNSFLNLNMRGCLISDLGLEYIANGNLKNSLEMLFLGECDRISDLGVDSTNTIYSSQSEEEDEVVPDALLKRRKRQNSPVRNSLFKRQKALDTDDPEDVEDPQTRKVLKMKMSNAELAGKLDVDCISLMTEAA